MAAGAYGSIVVEPGAVVLIGYGSMSTAGEALCRGRLDSLSEP
jgi:ActR/RegA family two-component response regulator